MPLPAAIVIPPAAGAICAGAAAASKSLALRAAPFFDVSTLSFTAVAAWLFRYFWKHKVPEWAKEDVSFRSLLPRKQCATKSKSKSKSNNTNDEEESTTQEQQIQNAPLSASAREEREMANLSSVLEKLQALINSVQLADDHPSILQQYAALLAYIQLSAQVKRQEQERPQQDNRDTINHSSESNSNSMENKEEEEKKKNKVNTTLIVESRDSLYDNAKPPSATIVPPTSSENYENFAQNPKESSLFRTLQQALTFATWAYYDDSDLLAEKLAALDFELLLHSKSDKPGHAAYYLAVSSKAQKQLVIGVRGTSTLEDIVTDCCGRAVPMDDRPYYYDHDRGSKLNKSSNDFDPSRVEVKAATAMQVVRMQNGEVVLEDPTETTSTTRASLSPSAEILDVMKGHESIWVEHSTDHIGGGEQDNDGDRHQQHMLRCHEGIMMSAKRLVNRVQEHIEDWVVKRGYQLVLCGHSLGAGCASLAAVLLRSRLPELQETHNNTASSPAKMRVYCFAPPPVLDRDAALAATSYCTSIVNNADMIPRCSLENLLILLEILRGVWEELQHQGLAPMGPKSTAAFFRKIAKGSTDEHMLLTTHDVRVLMYKAMEKIKANQSAGEVKDNNKVEGVGQTELDENCSGSCTFEASGKGAHSTANAEDNDAKLETEKIPSNPVPLYIPGVVLLAYEPWRDADPDPSLAEELLATTEAEIEAESDYKVVRGEQMRPFMWKVTDGTTNALHFLEMEARMGVDHTTTSYYSLLDMEYEF